MQVWINGESDATTRAISLVLDKASAEHDGKELKAFVIFVNPTSEAPDTISSRLDQLAKELRLQNTMLLFLDGPDDNAIAKYEVNTDPKVSNTVFVYRDELVKAKFVNLGADDKSLSTLRQAIDAVVS